MFDCWQLMRVGLKIAEFEYCKLAAFGILSVGVCAHLHTSAFLLVYFYLWAFVLTKIKRPVFLRPFVNGLHVEATNTSYNTPVYSNKGVDYFS